MGESGLNNERDIINRFQELKQELNTIASKYNDVENQSQEHESVIKTLIPLEGSRKCFRLIGGVLVERTVAEVLPAVKNNNEQIRMVSEELVIAKLETVLICWTAQCRSVLLWRSRSERRRRN